MLRIKADGPDLTPTQAKVLDDEFFLARPHEYFSARISSLLRSPNEPVVPNSEEAREFNRLLGVDNVANVLDHSPTERDLQVAIDCVTVRHHAAESLVRFLHALLVSSHRGGDAACVWVALTDGPNGLHQVVTELQTAIAADERALQRVLFQSEGPLAEQDVRPFQVAVGWIYRAMELLTDNELTINAAHNKMKHGLAVRARGDERIELVMGELPDTSGTIPIGTFGPGRSWVVMDRPMVTYLARAYPPWHHGLEATALRVDPSATLAETSMLSWVYASAFGVAATKHFGAQVGEFAPVPPSRSGPTPDELVESMGLVASGMRTAVTTSDHPDATARPSGVFFPGVFKPMEIDFDSERSATVVE
jgi:hypothetical protein